MHIETRLIRGTTRQDPAYGSIGTPIYATANFRFDEHGRSRGYDYSRSGNPTRAALEDALAELEGGAGAVATGSGMAAVTTVLALLPAGSHVVCTHDCYGGTARLLTHQDTQGILSVSFVDLADPEALRAAIRPTTRLLWIETPSNPLLRVVDCAPLIALAHERGLLVCVDNTFLSPALFQPLALGADLVVHSTTKWIAGHSDVIGGAVVARTSDLAARVQWLANCLGTTAGAFDSWLVLRGAKSLAVRMRRHESGAHTVAHALKNHAAVREVYYPGLATHASHATAHRQFRGFGGIVSFRVHGTADEVRAVLRRTDVFSLAESLGGVESLIEHPATMSHASMTPAQRAHAGITDDLIRLSIGLEDPADLIADLEHALANVSIQASTIVNQPEEV